MDTYTPPRTLDAVEFQDDGTSERVGGIQEERWHPDHVAGSPVGLLDSGGWWCIGNYYVARLSDHKYVLSFFPFQSCFSSHPPCIVFRERKESGFASSSTASNDGWESFKAVLTQNCFRFAADPRQ